MKKILTFIIAFVIASNFSFSQCNWFRQSIPGVFEFNDVLISSEYNRFIIGNGGKILKSPNSGYQWFEINSGVVDDLKCISFPTDSIGYIGGSNGRILKTIDGGANWQAISFPQASIINDIYFVNALTGYVATQNGSIYKTINGGGTWQGFTFDGQPLKCIFFINETTGWAAGEKNYIYKTVNSGTNWTRNTNLDTLGTINDIFFSDDQTGYIVGNSGMIKKTVNGGSIWQNLNSGTTQNINAIDFYSDSYGYAVGDNGLIIKTLNYGASWESLSSGTNSSYRSIDMNWGEKYIVGSNSVMLKYEQNLILAQPYDKNVCTGNFTIPMSVGLATSYYNWIKWQINKGTGWADCIYDGYHVDIAFPTMYISNYNIAFNNYKYRCIINTHCGTDTSDVSTLHIRNPISSVFLNLADTYCAYDTMIWLNSSPNTGSYTGNGIVDNYKFNPSFVGGDSTVITYIYTDATGCEARNNKTVRIYSLPEVFTDSLNNPNCGGNNGFISLSIYGQAPPYSQVWAHGSTSSILTGLQAGIYKVTVTDSRQCKTRMSFNLNNYNSPYPELNSNGTSCGNACDAEISTYVFDGVPPYNYQWSTGSTLTTLTNQCSGTYSVTVTDSLGCKGFQSIIVTPAANAGKIIGSVYINDTININGITNIKLFKQSVSGVQEISGYVLHHTQNNSFIIENIPTGSYYVQAIPDHDLNPLLCSSFLTQNGTTSDWINADTLYISCGSEKYAYIQLGKLFYHGTGNGVISGYLNKASAKSGKKAGIYKMGPKAEGEPIPGAEIYVELEPDDQPIANTQTDNSGFYSVENLPMGSYSIIVQIPGCPMVDSLTVNLSASNPVSTQNNYFVELSGNMVQDTARYYGIDANSSDIKSIEIFPNPAKENINISISLNKNLDVSVELYNITGQLVNIITKENQEKECNIKLNTSIASGVYFIKIKSGKTVFIKKIIKE